MIKNYLLVKIKQLWSSSYQRESLSFILHPHLFNIVQWLFSVFTLKWLSFVGLNELSWLSHILYAITYLQRGLPHDPVITVLFNNYLRRGNNGWEIVVRPELARRLLIPIACQRGIRAGDFGWHALFFEFHIFSACNFRYHRFTNLVQCRLRSNLDRNMLFGRRYIECLRILLCLIVRPILNGWKFHWHLGLIDLVSNDTCQLVQLVDLIFQILVLGINTLNLLV